MSVFSIMLNDKRYESIEAALKIMWKDIAPGGKLTHFKSREIQGTPALTLMWNGDSSTHCKELPFALKDPVDAANFMFSWLKDQGYPKAPDTDGDCAKGYVIHNQSNRIGFESMYDPYSAIAIYPDWIVYGK